VLSGHFSRVVVVERDRYLAGPIPRDGVPQAHHVPVLLLRGQQILEEFFPGIAQEWTAEGGDMVDTADDFQWRTPAGRAPRFDSGRRFLGCSRPLIEMVVRRRVTAAPNVEFRESAEATGLGATAGGAIAGVRLRGHNGAAVPAVLEASLVADATGRGSRTPEWLAALGFNRPPETVVDGRVSYASRIYARSAKAQERWKATYCQAAPPRCVRGGLALPIEGERWMVTLLGGSADYPPADAMVSKRSLVRFRRPGRITSLRHAARHCPSGPPARWKTGFGATIKSVCPRA
jgi:2-polyprenyl-6-methoxyphenol hydroxylase-like FAD-dependent oxidoreductase